MQKAKITLLYAEDHGSVKNSMYGILSKYIEKVILACDGHEAYELYKANESQIDLLITDIKMPHVDGLDLINLIRKDNPNVKIYITSAHEKDNFSQELSDLNVDFYFVKPINFIELLEQISKDFNLKIF